jgi:hypothetical protein
MRVWRNVLNEDSSDPRISATAVSETIQNTTGDTKPTSPPSMGLATSTAEYLGDRNGTGVVTMVCRLCVCLVNKCELSNGHWRMNQWTNLRKFWGGKDNSFTYRVLVFRIVIYSLHSYIILLPCSCDDDNNKNVATAHYLYYISNVTRLSILIIILLHVIQT